MRQALGPYDNTCAVNAKTCGAQRLGRPGIARVQRGIFRHGEIAHAALIGSLLINAERSGVANWL
jgi:hypothetical protein